MKSIIKKTALMASLLVSLGVQGFNIAVEYIEPTSKVMTKPSKQTINVPLTRSFMIHGDGTINKKAINIGKAKKEITEFLKKRGSPAKVEILYTLNQQPAEDHENIGIIDPNTKNYLHVKATALISSKR